ncbi:MAG: response regulator, partial [Burkholderiales bacterium]
AAAEAKGVELVVRRTGFAVQSDRILLERVLANLVSNALRYTDRGRVLVAARRCGKDRESIRIDVRDSGPGIADHQREAIFQEFVQLANPERDRSKGLGLGLAIVRRLVSLLGHQLALRSRVGQGSTFTVRVPAARVAPKLPAAALHQATPVDTETRRAIETPLAGVTALVIDDDALVRESLNRLLATWGASVQTASGDPGLPARLDPAQAPDLVLCDLRLAEGMDGVQLVAAIRSALGKPVPAVLITGDTDPERVRMANQPGDPVLHKPVRPAQLRALLRTLLRPRDA